MKNFRLKIFKRKDGFSLVELMVVVAIIGILAAIAVPNVSRYMLKARQSEAKTNLAALYSAEKAVNVEYNGYSTSFIQVGFRPEGQLRYNVGFGAVNDSLSGYTGAAAVSGDLNVVGFCVAGAACSCLTECGTNGAETIAGSFTTTGSTFSAAAQSDIRKASDIDTWTIDQNKNVSNTTDGLN